MSNYSDLYEQLVIELYVRDFKASCAFYQAFGFQMVLDEGNFAGLHCEDALLFLEANPNAPTPPFFPVCNICILVPNVDDCWTLPQQMGVTSFTTNREPFIRNERFHDCWSKWDCSSLRVSHVGY